MDALYVSGMLCIRPVLLRRRLVVDRQQLHGLRVLGLQVDDGVGAVPLTRVEDEVAVKVPGVRVG